MFGADTADHTRGCEPDGRRQNAIVCSTLSYNAAPAIQSSNSPGSAETTEISSPSEGRWKRLPFTKAIIVIVEAFQEALDMRRVAHRIYFLSDE